MSIQQLAMLSSFAVIQHPTQPPVTSLTFKDFITERDFEVDFFSEDLPELIACLTSAYEQAEVDRIEITETPMTWEPCPGIVFMVHVP